MIWIGDDGTVWDSTRKRTEFAKSSLEMTDNFDIKKPGSSYLLKCDLILGFVTSLSNH